MDTMSIERQLDFAEDRDIRPGFLHCLTDSTNDDVLCALANNPVIETHTIEELAYKGIDSTGGEIHMKVRWAIARRTDLPLHVAEGMQSLEKHPWVIAQLETNPAVAPRIDWDAIAEEYDRAGAAVMA